MPGAVTVSSSCCLAKWIKMCSKDVCDTEYSRIRNWSLWSSMSLNRSPSEMTCLWIRYIYLTFVSCRSSNSIDSSPKWSIIHSVNEFITLSSSSSLVTSQFTSNSYPSPNRDRKCCADPIQRIRLHTASASWIQYPHPYHEVYCVHLTIPTNIDRVHAFHTSILCVCDGGTCTTPSKHQILGKK